MRGKFLKLILGLSLFCSFSLFSCSHLLGKYLRTDHRQNFTKLREFVCLIAKDESEKHPEMQTIAFVELENNFPSSFSAEILKCLPTNVAKLILQPRSRDVEGNESMILPKQSMVIYVADSVSWVRIKTLNLLATKFCDLILCDLKDLIHEKSNHKSGC